MDDVEPAARRTSTDDPKTARSFQAANAFTAVGHSPARRPGIDRHGRLLGAVAAEPAMLAGFLLIPPVASILDHAPPPAAGLAVASLTAPGIGRHRGAHRTSLDEPAPTGATDTASAFARGSRRAVQP